MYYISNPANKGEMQDGSPVLICALPTCLSTFCVESHAQPTLFKQNLDPKFCSKKLEADFFFGAQLKFMGCFVGWACRYR